MTINPSAINPIALPSVSLAERSHLPIRAAVYFAIDSTEAILYIGKAKSLRKRWMQKQHHRFEELSRIGSVRIAWIVVDDHALLDSIEAACIAYFAPLLNGPHYDSPGGKFPLQFTEDERRALKIASAQMDTSMNQFVRDAIAEKIARLNAESKESGVLAKASEKPA